MLQSEKFDDQNIAYSALYQMAIANDNHNQLSQNNSILTLQVLHIILNVVSGANSKIRVCWAAVRALSGLLLKTPLDDVVYEEKILPILNQLLKWRSGRVCAQGAVLISATYNQYKRFLFQ